MSRKKVCVVGAGISGISVANKLARFDLEVVLIDRNPYPGGRAAHYGCKATDSCVHCGVCLIRDAIAQLEGNSRVNLLLSSTPQSIHHSNGSFKIDVETLEREETHTPLRKTFLADAVVVSTGFTPFDPVINRKWGYGENPRVLTGSDLERLFNEEKYLPDEIDDESSKIAFIQCVGSRNIMEGMAQCSRICCAFALRTAGRIKHEKPEAEIDFYYMDIQRFGKNFENFWAAISDKINFIRSNPITIEVNSEGKPIIRFDSISDNRCERVTYDLVVLSHGLGPSEHTEELAEMFDLDFDAHGFFDIPPYQKKFPTEEDKGKGVFVAGTCQGPMNIAECVEDASNVAEHVLKFLK